MFMRRSVVFVTFAIAHSMLALATSQAIAESPEHYCRYYATHAIHLAEAARSVSSCRHLIDENPQRWSLNYNQHFDYCLRIYGSGAGMAEDSTRSRQVAFCAGP